MVIVCVPQDIYDNDDWDRLHPAWWSVDLLIRVNLPLDPEIYATVRIFPWVRGPHFGARLADHTEGVLHCTSFDGVLEGGQPSVSVFFAKDLEDGHWVLPPSQVGVNIVFLAQ